MCGDLGGGGRDDMTDTVARADFVARLEAMQAKGDHWLTIPAVLALLADCERAASEPAQPSPSPTPWYPPGTTGWVEVPPELMGIPEGLADGDEVEVLLAGERENEGFFVPGCSVMASKWNWNKFQGDTSRIVAYRKVSV